MKNIQRLTRHIAQTGAKNILIHTIPGTQTWIVCQKIEKDKWTLTLMDPMKDTAHNLGTVNNKDHLNLWQELIEKEIERRTKT